MGKPDAPTPPDPYKVASAQTGANIGTAIANTEMGQINQITPDGALTYDQIGTYNYADPFSKKVYEIPKYSLTQTLSEMQQRIKDQTDQAGLNLASTAADQSAFFQDYLGKPVDLSNEATEARLMELGRKRLDPMLSDRKQRLEQQLADRGLKMGGEDFARQMELNTQGENDAYNQLLLAGRGQSVQEALTERNQPINELTALLSGGQVSQPNFLPTSTAQMPTVDYAGLVNTNFNQQMGIYNQESAAQQALVGGLFKLGAAGIGLSDRRLKKDVEKVGTVDDLGLYRYRYKGEAADAPKTVGVMAQEVERKRPEAALQVGGVKMVDYARLVEGV